MLDYLRALSHWLWVWAPVFGRMALEVFLIFLFVYAFLHIMEGTRGAGVLKGLALFAAILTGITMFVTGTFHLDNVNWVIRSLAPVILIPVFILFQPEIRRGLTRLGLNPLFRMLLRPHSHFTEELVKATFSLSRDKTGGLIVLEREVGLTGLVEPGVKLDADVSAELIKTIFWPDSPLHDGAIIIRSQRIAAAGCLLPLADNPRLSAELGTRHRAGIGITEESDAVAIIISEQTGQVSLAAGGILRRSINEEELRHALEELAVEPMQRQ